LKGTGGLYVFVVVTYYNNIRLLAVDRIKQIDPTEKTFEWPANFDPEELLNKAFGLNWDELFTAKIKSQLPSPATYGSVNGQKSNRSMNCRMVASF
jgi:hypothetical protein